ncbi:MAG: septum formation protein Maf [Candidatus Omnitrophica bacterium]|nr:septum formation protein Maf [Candidatus Omnitrophota bacterium]
MKADQDILYLASQSPRRREILTQMKVPFRVVESSYEERLKQTVLPHELALEHAEGKARQADVPDKARFVLGADTVVACAGQILGKPRDEKAAVAMIQLLSGRLNEVVTGIALLDRETGILTRAASHSLVSITKMDEVQCLNYVRSSHPYDKAGGYAIQGKPRIARRVKGSYSNIVGFPRELVRRLLKQAGFLGVVLMLIQTCLQAPAAAAESGKVRSEHAEASLISEYTAVQPGKPMRVALKLKTDPDWHTYWINSGDSGLATSIRWTLPEGFSAGPIQWPYPSAIRQDPLVTYGYHGEVWLFTTLQVPASLSPGSKVVFRAKADWLECEVPCLPGQAELALELDVQTKPRLSLEWQQGAAHFLGQLPKPAPAGRAAFEQNEKILILKSNLAAQEAYFFPYDSELLDHAAPQVLRTGESALTLEIQRSRLKTGLIERLTGVLVLTAKGQRQAYEVNLTEKEVLQPVYAVPSATEPVDLPAKPALKETPQLMMAQATTAAAVPPATVKSIPFGIQEPQEPISLMLALVFAFFGGLILNLMPCVLPVLSLKILGFVTQRSHPGLLRAHGLIWTAGVLVSFWILSGLMLALRWGGSSLGWGFQLQSPGMVAALAVIFLLLTLNLAGFFEVGLLLTRFGGWSSKSGEKNGQAFAAGVLAVVAATPCTAPFMGAAMGYALTQPVMIVFAIFTFLGLGMAFPFLLLAFMPGGLKFLPKPGPWMNTFKKILALPLGLTVVWLLWVLALQVEASARLWSAGFLLTAALAAILYGRVHPAALAGVPEARRKSRLFLVLLAAAAALTVWSAERGVSTQPLSAEAASKQGVRWQVYAREEVERLVGEGKPVFINFTARWCLSCQVNDRLVFRTQAAADAFQVRGIQAFKADWTSKDISIARALAGYGRASVPLYVFYDGNNKPPRFLPEVLTVNLLLEALRES